jgi:hypothetical protein
MTRVYHEAPNTDRTAGITRDGDGTVAAGFDEPARRAGAEQDRRIGGQRGQARVMVSHLAASIMVISTLDLRIGGRAMWKGRGAKLFSAL